MEVKRKNSTLMHYGVKGMKWHHKKKSDDEEKNKLTTTVAKKAEEIRDSRNSDYVTTVASTGSSGLAVKTAAKTATSFVKNIYNLPLSSSYRYVSTGSSAFNSFSKQQKNF